MYNPIDLALKTEQLVTKASMKKYYRFRPTSFYGGIATADTVGCNLRCTFCWSGMSVWNAGKTGELYTPVQVAEKLMNIVKKKGYHQVRISGGEPTIGRQHLVEVLQFLDADVVFVLETNGILLGYDKEYVQDLAGFRNLHVRVCLKGCSAKEFSWLTGAAVGFEYQLQALSQLMDAGISFHVAVVSVHGNNAVLMDRLSEIGVGEGMIEEEKITLYPQVRKRLAAEGLLGYFE